ncbi:MAG: phosphoenolpyruvate carboxykinase (ATP), partial [Planctomycetes bacterium]|nr:phosphoenolpyruvate carboxykinase (ATP) [Planctomycetota bacterium]
SLTDNTRAAYPITHIENALRTGISGHPKNIVMLTCDAVGVMPPIAKLTPEQAMYHFLSGYTANIAKVSNGVSPEPEITFNTCFGASSMTLCPTVYAKMLGERIRKHNVNCWLVNTGWIGGAFGVGERIPLSLTRAMINAALLGKLEDVPMEQDRQFGLYTPKLCEGVPSEMLNPRNAWRDTNSYNEKASKLVYMFDENFEKFA